MMTMGMILIVLEVSPASMERRVVPRGHEHYAPRSMNDVDTIDKEATWHGYRQ
jgi:hypothetical protein